MKKGRVFLWAGVFVLICLFALTAVGEQSVTRYAIGELYSNLSFILLAFPVCILELVLIKKKEDRWYTAVLPIVAAVLLLFSAYAYGLGDWGGLIVGFLVWLAAFGCSIGVLAAAFIDWMIRAGSGFRNIVLVCLVLLCIVSFLMKPAALLNKINIDAGEEYLWSFQQEPAEWYPVNAERDDLIMRLRSLRVQPVLFDANVPVQACKIIRLNEEYVLFARYNDVSYICRYSGPLEAFDGSGAKWKTYRNDAYSMIY
ncbi:MAG: hypothetical protein J5555_09165 [Firmicutes bacterium]|nr:hypothetical protein [Bacillota bacterium]